MNKEKSKNMTRGPLGNWGSTVNIGLEEDEVLVPDKKVLKTMTGQLPSRWCQLFPGQSPSMKITPQTAYPTENLE